MSDFHAGYREEMQRSQMELDMRRCEALEEGLGESGDGDTYFVHCEIILLPEALQVEVP